MRGFLFLGLKKMEKLIQIGICTQPHGIKGDFEFKLSSPDDSILNKNFSIKIFPLNEKSSISLNGEVYKIKNIRFGNKVIVTLFGVDNRNVVEKMIPFKVMVDRSDFPETEDNEYYVADLLGLKVINFSNNDELGVVKDFYDNGQQIVLVLKLKDSLVDLLFIEQFVPEVNIEEGYLKIILPEFVE